MNIQEAMEAHSVPEYIKASNKRPQAAFNKMSHPLNREH